MKILLTTLGSRGDIQPYLALAVGLKHAGHQPTWAAPETFADWIQSYGVGVIPTENGITRTIEIIEQHANGFKRRST